MLALAQLRNCFSCDGQSGRSIGLSTQINQIDTSHLVRKDTPLLSSTRFYYEIAAALEDKRLPMSELGIEAFWKEIMTKVRYTRLEQLARPVLPFPIV
ncbi:hypothetical protein BOTNAR_0004g00570 [Botryotinia narcissicola]|uniref:Uncharacterized protein n=1 Tax=Botryotinia narcissicola TaxID=278944 RepID=A0A4Z1JEV9_9HELO|nr:hypothetical protein BOTNAR_0004g00570 [Botryotinia narcissicola]